MPHDKRYFPRQIYKIPITYNGPIISHDFVSSIQNYSRTGMCFESEKPLEPGSEVGIKVENYSPGSYGPEAYKFYVVRVKWSGEFDGIIPGCFFAGAEVLRKSSEVFNWLLFQQTHYSCDFCGTLVSAVDVYQTEDAFFCSSCNIRYESIPEGIIKKSLNRFLIGNVI